MSGSGLHAAQGDEALNYLTKILRGLVVARLGTDEAVDTAVDHTLDREPADRRQAVLHFGGDPHTGQGVESRHAPDGAAVNLLDQPHDLVVACDVAVSTLLGVDGPAHSSRSTQRHEPRLDEGHAEIIVSDEADTLIVLDHSALFPGEPFETRLVETAAGEHERGPFSIGDLGGHGRDHRVD